MRMSVAGSALDYVRYGEEAARLAQECGDPALRAAIGTFPAFGHFHAGDGRAVLEWSARVLEEVGSDNVLGKEIVGYSPRAGMLFSPRAGPHVSGAPRRRRGTRSERRSASRRNRESSRYSPGCK